jgi:esterase/lipase superfamily enzyme
MSAGSYPYQPNRAELAARVLARHIGAAIGRRRSTAPIRLSIVAHSLGCRLTLELLRLLDASVLQGVLKIELVVLMAAAVPLYEVKRNKNYDLARTNAEKTLVYFSSKDKTLQRFFRPGQRFMSSDPTNAIWERGALGHYGLKNVSRVESIEGSHDHSDYWPDHSISTRVGMELDRQKRFLSRRALLPRSVESGRLVSGRDIAPRQMRFGVRDCNCS